MSVSKPWKALERQIVRDLKAAGFDAKRNWSSQFVKKDGCDVFAPPYVIQCKYGATPNPRVAFTEAKEAAGKNAIPIAITRKAREGRTLVTMDYRYWLQLIKA